MDFDSTADRLGNFDGDVRPGMAAERDARLARLGRGPVPAAPERPRDLPDDSIEIDIAGDAGPASSGTRFARTSIRLLRTSSSARSRRRRDLQESRVCHG